MLEQLFGSRTRWKLLKVFLSHEEERFFIRELTRLTGEKLNSVRRELANLEEWGVIRAEKSEKEGTKSKSKAKDKKYFRAETSFVLFTELKDLIMKSWLLVEKSLVKKISQMGKIKLLILSGRFVNNEQVETDLLIVGTINKEKLNKFIRQLSRSFGEDIHFTLMTAKEYNYRKDITDKFLYKIFETEHIVVLDNLK
jgi:hypothetical protein